MEKKSISHHSKHIKTSLDWSIIVIEGEKEKSYLRKINFREKIQDLKRKN